MALMYTDNSGVLQGVLRNASFDADIGDEDDFLLTIPKDDFFRLGSGCRVFDSEFPAFGGMVEGVEVNTESDTVSFTGSTWRGLLAQKVICPLAGQAYKTMTGSTTYIIGTLLTQLDFCDLFFVPDYDPATQGTGDTYTFKRYVTLLEGLTDFLQSRDKVLYAVYDVRRKKIKLTARIPQDYSSGRGFIQSPFNYIITKPWRKVNHMIALGRGELTARTVIHLYLQSDGSIGTTQQYSGVDEVTCIYEDTMAETQNELTSLARKKFMEMIRPTVEITAATGTDYYIGDVIGGYEPFTKTKVTATISSLILQINGDQKNVSYKTKE